MIRINTATKAVDLHGAGKHGFKDGNVGLGIAPTAFEAAWCNGVQEELLALIEAAGITPSSAVLNQVSSALQNIYGDGVGKIDFFPFASAPTGYVKANGAILNRTSFPRLFSKYGTTFGPGDGVTTFGTPDWRGEFFRALDDGRGVDVGRVLNSFQAHMFASHTHGPSGGQAGFMSNSFPSTLGTGGAGAGFIGEAFQMSVTGASGGTETRPRNVALLACIKF
jgi:microcystin-dependent protein